MIEFEKPNIASVVVDEENNYGKFECQPLERGYGTTLGNSLRRILLSSLPGAAITGIKIEGIQHEFTTIPNIVEDVMDIILNLKEIRFKYEDDEPKKISLKHKGAGEITAGDIKEVAGLEVLNPEVHIATASAGANLNMELTVERGRGYNTSDKNAKENEDISYLPIDSIFTPVVKVNYSVENTRVGNRVDYDKLIMEIWTDGSITAKEALSYAAKIMSGHLEAFTELSDKVNDKEIMVETKIDNNEELLELKVDELALTKRPLNCLRIQEVKTLEDLISYSIEEISQFKNLGAKSLEEIVDTVHNLGFKFKMEKYSNREN